MPDASITGTNPTTPAMAVKRRSGTAIVAGIVIAAILAVASVFLFRAATGPDPIAARVPASVSTYIQVTLQPSIAQKRLLRDLVDQLPGGRDRVEASLDTVIEQVLTRVGLDLEVDGVRGWVGDQVAAVTWNASSFFVAHATDLTLAQRAVDEINAGHEAVASLSAGFVTIGGNDASIFGNFLSAAHESPLSRDKPFKAARARVGGDGVLLVRASAADAIAGFGPLGLPGGSALTPSGIPEGNIVAGAQFVDGGLKVSFAEESMLVDRPLPASDDLALAHELAEHAHGVFGFNDLASLLREALVLAPPEAVTSFESEYGLDLEEDVLSWLGDEVAFRVVNFGDDEHHATIVVQASDEEAMRSFVQTVRGFLAIAPLDGVRVSGTDDDSFRVRAGGFVADVSIDGGRLTIEMASRNATTTNNEAPAIAGLPELASFAGAVNIDVIEDETPFGDLFAADGPLGAYGPALETVGVAAVREGSGPVFSFTLLFKDAA